MISERRFRQSAQALRVFHGGVGNLKGQGIKKNALRRGFQLDPFIKIGQNTNILH